MKMPDEKRAEKHLFFVKVIQLILLNFSVRRIIIELTLFILFY